MKKILPVFIMSSVVVAIVTQGQSMSNAPPTAVSVPGGRSLFLKNCAHCHGIDAEGDEGPDLHDLAWTDQQITTRIRNGKAGQMTAFHDHFSPDQINAIIAYLRTLK